MRIDWKGWLAIVGGIATVLGLAVIIFGLISFLIMFAWNAILRDVFGFPAIDLVQGLAVIILLSLIRGGIGLTCKR